MNFLRKCIYLERVNCENIEVEIVKRVFEYLIYQNLYNMNFLRKC